MGAYERYELVFMTLCSVLALTTFALGEVAESWTGRALAGVPWNIMATVLILVGLFFPI